MNSTSVIVPSYAYTLIKITFLKQLIMDEIAIQKLEDITEIKQFIESIGVFYPGLVIESYKIEDIEKALFHTYIKLIGRIIYISPETMRLFLRNYLMKYEIMNIKRIILGTILGMSVDEKSSMVNMLVEKYLDNTDFIKELIEITSLEEIQAFMKPTIYNKIIREGILYFRKTNEIFVLESFLDQFYYKNLRNEIKFLTKKEKIMISPFINYISEIYNMRLIYRGIKNNIEKNLLKQLLIDNYLFLNKTKLNDLMNLKDKDEFIDVITQHLSTIKELKSSLITSSLDQEHFIWSIEKLYLNYYFKLLEIKSDDIEFQAIYKILEVLIKKDKEIRLFILPKLINVIYKKYKLLK
ncbi:MAG: V-type ATPase subunit [Promethearchaeota archaeon]|nr:MAG: V-type ATPase subunit [Candidatus Lokiarchaeota archaeon]